MKNKSILLFMMFALVNISFSALAETATLTYSAQPKIFCDIPFNIYLQMSADNSVKNIKLYTTSQDKRIVFEDASRGEWLSNMNPPDVRLQETNQVLFYSIGPDGSTNQAAGNKGVATITARIKGVDSSRNPLTDSINLDSAKENEVGIYPQGTFTIAGGGAVLISPIKSKCGDGTVAYDDRNDDGINNDVQEKCETGRTYNLDGTTLSTTVEACLDGCSKIMTGYIAENCGWLSTNCKLKPVTPKQMLWAKLNAIINGKCAFGQDATVQLCSQNNDALYAVCPTTKPNCILSERVPRTAYHSADPAPALNLNQKIELVSLIGQALKDYFAAPGVLS